MSWSDLHGGQTVYGKRIHKVDNLGGMNGLPSQTVLASMLDKAQGLDLKATNSGMSFTYCRVAVVSGAAQFQKATSIVDKFSKPAAICYEDRNFPVELDPGHILIRQNVAPCTRCRASFRGWAKQRNCTIIVAGDEGYDASADNTVFIFSPTGAVYQWY